MECCQFVEAIFSSQLSFGELDTIFNDECEGNQVKHVIDEAVNKIEIYSQNDVELLNSEITEDEIVKAIKNLKNSKAPGIDAIVNENMKTTFVESKKTLFDVTLLTPLRMGVLDDSMIP
ncbi:Hypothetical predicted protein [Mytilus galloprovincialis]|uniref:Uncharacterized protein n=1 Tax=Mytilus galloprovincialis TaxID=29158 RepID=A0A8B6CAY6_MYTGA|nr:Hypothetical predicted protein [Mytilus galloprovincialis]